MKKQLALLPLLLISSLSFADTTTSSAAGSESSVNANTTSSSQGGSVGNTTATGGSATGGYGGSVGNTTGSSSASTGSSSANSGATNSSANSGATSSNANTGASKSVGNASGNVSIDNHGVTNAPAVDLSKSVGFAQAPALTTTFSETCMGSTSAGAGFAGGAFSIGSTWEDEACIRRLDAREMKSMGDAEIAKELMCGSAEVRAAALRVGRPCAIDGGKYAATAQPINISQASQARQQELYEAAVKKQVAQQYAQPIAQPITPVSIVPAPSINRGIPKL